MTCKEFQLQIYLLESGELTGDEKTELAQHSKECPRCQNLLAANRYITDIYNQIPPVLYSKNLKQHIRQQIIPKQVMKSDFAGNYRTWLAAAACLLLVASAIYRIYFHENQPVLDIFDTRFTSLNVDSIMEKTIGVPDMVPKCKIEFDETSIQEISNKLKALKNTQIDFSLSSGLDLKVKSIQQKIKQLKQEPII